MGGFLFDLRQAVRALLKSPAYAAITIATLALGIGANSAIFSIVNSVVLKPLAYPNPDQLMYLTTQFPRLGFDRFWVSPPEYFEYREINQSFAAVGAFQTSEGNLTAGDRPRRVRTALVDDHLMRALGVQAAQGRVFAAGETDITGPSTPEQPVPPPALAILSHELWTAAFGGTPMVGQLVDINGRRHEVIGVMPPGADVMDNRTEVWLPIGLNPANRQNRGNHSLFLIGRLKDGITPEAARTELTALIQNWSERVGLPAGPGGAGHIFSPLEERGRHILQMDPLREQIIGSASRAIWVLQAGVGLVLLIACTNLASLLLARAERRHREFAVRTALGASRGRLLQQFLIEGVLLSMAGGLGGLLLAYAAVQALLSAYPASLPRTADLTIDPLVLLFTFAVSLITGVLFGLTPLLHTRMKGLLTALQQGGARGGTGARHRVRRGLVMAEIAMAVMVTVGAGLLVRTVANLTNVDAGFDRSRLVTFSTALPGVNYPTSDGRVQWYQRLLDALRAVPGIQAVSAMSGLPPERPLNANDTEIDNYTAPPEGPFENVDYYQAVMSNYFETMGIPIVRGRGFEGTDVASSGMVAVVNETLANTFWRDLDPIGQRLRPCCGDAIPWFTVVGVAKDVKQGGLDQETGTEFYRLVDETPAGAPANFVPLTMNVALRTTLPPSALAPTIERIVREADPTVPVVRLQEMDAVFDETIRRPRLLAQLVGGFAGLALLLAAIGTYGVLSYMVVERRREIGIRMALGADRQNVLRLVLQQGLVLTLVGLVAGLAGAFGLSRLMNSLLFGVQASDPATMGIVAATIAVIATLACWLPAWRASRLDPNLVLRDD